MKRAPIFGALIAAALFLAACGGEGTDSGPGGGGTTSGPPTSTSTSTSTSAAGVTDTIALVDNAFDPVDVSVASSDLELVNEGQAIHNFTVEGSDIDVDIEAGEDAHATIDLEPGTYTMFCEFHRAQGMEGTLTVA